MDTKRIIINFAVAALIVTLTAEILFRLFIIAPSRQLFDEELGWRYMPNSKLVHSSEGYAKHQLNEQGMNDAPLNSLQNIKKVAVLGDSFVEALEVKRDKNFTEIIDRKYPHVDFINAGRGDFTPAHQPVVVNRLSKDVAISQIVLILSVGDIGALLTTPLEIIKDETGKIASLKPKNAAKDATKDKFRVILHNSALATYLMRKYHIELNKLLAFIQRPTLFTKAHSAPKPSEEPRNLGRIKTERLSYIFSKLNESAVTDVFYIPTVFYKAKGEAQISHFSRGEILIIIEAARATGLKFFDLSSLFLEDYSKYGKPSFGFHNTRVGGEGHLNEYGHQLVADYIDRTLTF